MKKLLIVIAILFTLAGCNDMCGGKDCTYREDGQPICNDGSGNYTRAACKGG